MSFPRDDYTPFGYLANPYHRARTYADVEGGLLRSTDNVVGFGWVEPTARKPAREARIVLLLRWNGKVYQTRADFARLGYRSRHHSSSLFSYDWELDFVSGSLSFVLADRDSLVGELCLENRGALPATCELFLVGQAIAAAERLIARESVDGWSFVTQATAHRWDMALSGTAARSVRPGELASLASVAFSDADSVAAGLTVDLKLLAGAKATITVALERDGSLAKAKSAAVAASGVCAGKRNADDVFYANVPSPVGDWPDAWRRGWVYDLETTRACIFPAGGVFRDEWPSWMITWPRVVVAEGTLDAARLSYADPQRALRLMQTIFADAPAPNVPCIFQGGEPNMVARDGTLCGTSPAWCLPFHNLWLLYCRTVDRAWLRDILPRLEAYLEYWLTERVDEDGWVVYKCTWEAGEDCSPRLDPAAEGDEVISRFVRPVELQATTSYSATVLARFARELGDDARVRRWSDVADEYAARTRQLWDPRARRFRDWDKRTDDFLRAVGVAPYWDTNPVRFSALSLTPLVAGIVSEEQKKDLEAEIANYDAAPWCFWPSWSYVVAEAATAAGWHRFAGTFASRIVDRVYRGNDRRTLADAARPTPGTSPEFWPLDLAEFNGSDGYGWGATTTSLWLRQIFGFLDDADTSEFAFTLAPNLPSDWLRFGRRFGFTGLRYRGKRLDVAYEVRADGLAAVVHCAGAGSIDAFGEAGGALSVNFDVLRGEASLRVENGSATRLVVRPTE